MRVLFDGKIRVHYGFLFLQPDDQAADLDRASGGQVNGLCGAAHSGVLAMVTGLHTGDVPVRIEAHEFSPPVAAEWEEVVEVSVTVERMAYCLAAFDVSEAVAMPGAGSYRARWHASGMDEARKADVRMDGDPALDRYLLQLWPALPAGDVIVRQTSEIASYWHSVARRTPPPPTPEEVAAQLVAEREVREREHRARSAAWEIESWGGRAPTKQLLAMGGRAQQLAAEDRDLVDGLAALPGSQQRVVAAWAARRTCEIAGIADLDWVGAGLHAVEQGTVPLPSPWHDWSAAWECLHPLPPGQTYQVEASIEIVTDAPSPRIDPGAVAISAVLRAGENDVAMAVMGAVSEFLNGSDDRRSALDEVLAQLRSL